MTHKNLIEISLVNSHIQKDIRYATPNNFLGLAVYPSSACYLHQKVAAALNKVQLELEERGLGLKVYDGYRPLHIQQLMWDAIQDEKFVSNPAVNKGRHTRGTAVDVTLVDANGNELEMPTDFDDFSEKAHSEWKDTSEIAIRNRHCLKTAMEKFHFIQLPTEWWHFDFRGWHDDEKYPALDCTYQELSK